MEDRTIKELVAAVCFTTVLLVAIGMGHDHLLVTGGLSALAAFGGFAFGRRGA